MSADIPMVASAWRPLKSYRMSRGRPQSAGIKKFHEEKPFLFLHINISLITRKEKSNCATVATHRHNEEATIGMEIHHTDAHNVFL